MHQVMLETNVLELNEEIANENKAFFQSHGVFVVNLMSAPGAGKTSLLEAMIKRFKDDYRLGVIEGDLLTTLDADRISALGVPSYQITTGSVCHLDARMVHHTLHSFPVEGFDLLFIENVGNLVCPAEFYLNRNKQDWYVGAGRSFSILNSPFSTPGRKMLTKRAAHCKRIEN